MSVGRGRDASAAILTAFAVLFFWPQLFGNRVLLTANPADWLPWAAAASPEQRQAISFNPDAGTSYYPRRVLARQAWEDGELPFWNPASFTGTPFLADPQSQSLYPPAWIVLPFDPARQLGLLAFLHVLIGGLGAWRLLRSHGVSREIAVLGGCAFALNGFAVKHFGLPTFHAAAAWAPWVFLGVRAVVREPNLRHTAWLALAGAMTFLAGQPQIALMIGIAAAVAAALSFATGHGRTMGHALRSGAALIGAGGLAVALASAQLLPTLDLASRSARAGLPFQTVASGSFHLVDLVRFVVPEFFGSPLDRNGIWSSLFLRGDSFYLPNQLNSLFAGTTLFVLSIAGMVHPKTRRAALPYTIVFGFFALVAFGTPVAALAHAFLPGFSFSRLDRAGNLVVFAQLVPAALAAARLLEPAGALRRGLGLAMMAAAVASAVAVQQLGPGLPEALGADRAIPAGAPLDTFARTAERTWWSVGFLGSLALAMLLPGGRVAASLPVAAAVLQLVLFASPYRVDRDRADVFPEAPGLAELRAAADDGRIVRFGRIGARLAYPLSPVLPPSTNAILGIRDLQGYNALADRRLGEVLETATGEPLFSHGIWRGRRIVAPERAASLEHPLFDALSVRVAAAVGELSAAGWEPDPARAPFALHRNVEALPRVRLLPQGHGTDEATLARAVEAADLRPADEVIWIGEGRVSGRGGSVEVLEEHRNAMTVRVRAEGEAVLVVADAWDPGWTATVDGRRTEVLPAWGLVRAVVIPDGTHHVVLRYSPPGFRAGAVVSLLALVAAGVLVAVGGGRRNL